MDSLGEMRRRGALEHALRSRVGVSRIDPVPVRVRVIIGRALAVTAAQVLVEWVAYGDYHVRWEDKWQVTRV